jgi:phenylpropionate dioxygenase-like ring-hydroxylating dioxygenase large terminal subunit
MLTQAENELMCRVGPGTQMGATLRRYWLPALASAQLPEPGGDPVHVELLGEHFVAFRDAEGNVGLLDENCCHRGASLLLGRVEGCGIRCIYHGWKFAVDGKVLETPNVADDKFKDRIRARAYPVREEGGLIWAYLGPRDQLPAIPQWPWDGLSSTHVLVTVHKIGCNFVQVLEGLVDSSHLGILHNDGLRASRQSDLTYAAKVATMQFDLAPRIEEEPTQFGFHYAALRAGRTSGTVEARITAFAMPCIVLNPNSDVATLVVPANDDSCRFFHVWWDAVRPVGEQPLREQTLRFVGLDDESMRSFGIAPDSRPEDAPNRQNRFHQNRSAVREGRSFSGIPGLIEEDVAASASGGVIRDRTKEMLSVADLAVGRLFRVYLESARRTARGEAPIGLTPGADPRCARGVSGEIEVGSDWRALVPTASTIANPK